MLYLLQVLVILVGLRLFAWALTWCKRQRTLEDFTNHLSFALFSYIALVLFVLPSVGSAERVGSWTNYIWAVIALAAAYDVSVLRWLYRSSSSPSRDA